jgi:hypothetical protein
MQLIIILERTSNDPLTINYVLRATVPSARQAFFADDTKTSAYKDASAEDVAALKAGQIVEKVCSDIVGGRTIAQIKSLLISAQSTFQTEVNGQSWNPFRYFGSSWDGTSWTDGGAA